MLSLMLLIATLSRETYVCDSVRLQSDGAAVCHADELLGQPSQDVVLDLPEIRVERDRDDYDATYLVVVGVPRIVGAL